MVNPVGQKRTRVAKSDETEAQWMAVARQHDLNADDCSLIWEAIMARREQNVSVGMAVAVNQET